MRNNFNLSKAISDNYWMDLLKRRPLAGERMSLEECRKKAPELKDFTDEDLLELRDQAYEYAEILFGAWCGMTPEEREKIKLNSKANEKKFRALYPDQDLRKLPDRKAS